MPRKVKRKTAKRKPAKKTRPRRPQAGGGVSKKKLAAIALGAYILMGASQLRFD